MLTPGMGASSASVVLYVLLRFLVLPPPILVVALVVRRRVRARANLRVPRPGVHDDAAAHAAALAPVLHAARGVVAVHRLVAKPALPRRVGGATEGAAAKLLHALDGFRVALPGSPLEVLSGEAHVVHVAEDAAAEQTPRHKQVG
jgi:hypothetical protein